MKASASLNKIQTGNLKLLVNCASNLSTCVCCVMMSRERILLNINMVSAIDPSIFENR